MVCINKQFQYVVDEYLIKILIDVGTPEDIGAIKIHTTMSHNSMVHILIKVTSTSVMADKHRYIGADGVSF